MESRGSVWKHDVFQGGISRGVVILNACPGGLEGIIEACLGGVEQNKACPGGIYKSVPGEGGEI